MKKSGGFSEFNEAAIDAARMLKKLEERLKALFLQARRASRKIESGETSSSKSAPESPMASPTRNSKFAPKSPLRDFKFAPKSPLRNLKFAPESSLVSPKRLLATLSNKAAPLLQRKKAEEEEEKGGLWQREILMGEKCQPLNFSGVIYYDKHGKPRSPIPPRSPLRGGGNRPLVQSFSFPVPLPEKKDY